jgi:ComF family protein
MNRTSVDGALSAWLPARCAFCSAALPGGAVCAGCAASLPWNDPACLRCALPLPGGGTCGTCSRAPPPFDAAWCAFRYEAPVDALVQGLKFNARLQHAPLLGALLAQRLAQRATPLPELLLPVPLHAWRLARRGFNQALEVARHLAPALALTLAPTGARRVRRTQEQTDLSAAQRRRNVRGAFAVDAALAGRSVALLDDVMTTGATLAELARACRAAGAARIEAWAVARAP